MTTDDLLLYTYMSKSAKLSRTTCWSERPDYRWIVRNRTPVYDKPLSKSGTIVIQDVVKWPHPECNFYLKSLDGNYSLQDWKIPIGTDTSLYRHICRLRETLVWWEQFTPQNKRLSSGYSILYQNLLHGHKFADELDDQIKYGMRLAASLALNYGKEEYPLFCKDFEDLDLCFSPHHLIPFERPISQDIELVFSEEPEIPNDLLNKFREIVEEHIKNPIERKRTLDDVDRLRFTGSSTSFDIQNNKRIPKTVAEAHSGTLQTTKTFAYDYVEVLKGPHESRACVVPTKETLHSITLLELQLRQVISCKWDCIRETNFDWLPDYLSTYSKKLFVMSDQKKCGLTFPRRLLIELYKVLQERFPSWDFDLAEGLQNSYIKYEGSMRQMTGGPGLGQFNMSISLIMGLLFEIWKRDQDPELHLDGRFYNDDQVIRFTFLEARREPLPEWVNNLALNWDMHMESYGLQVHKKKPFISMGGVFLEVYGNGFPVASKKTCQKVGNIFHVLTSPNIAEAKELFSSIYDSLELEHQTIAHNILLARLAPLWGYEFYPQEVYLPYQFGGWVRFRTEEGLDNLFNTVELIPDKFKGLIRLPFVSKKQNRNKKLQPIKSFTSRVNNSFKNSNLQILPKWDYPTIVKTSLKGARASYNESIKESSTFLNDRQKVLKMRPMSYKQFFSMYWELILEEGKAFAPPYSECIKENSNFLIRKPLYSGEPLYKDDPLRVLNRIRQELGQIDKFLSFWTVGTSNNINYLLYCLINSLNIKEFILTPKMITLIMILGEDKLLKIIEYSLRKTGKIYIPDPPVDILSEIGISHVDQKNNIIFLDHTTQSCFITGMDYSFEPEEFRVKAHIVQTINNYLTISTEQNYIGLNSYDHLIELLLKDHHGLHTVPQYGTSQLHADIQVSQEDRDLLAYLIYQVNAPTHHFSEEEMIRQGLAAQIYGSSDQTADVFSDEEGLLDMFG